MDASCPESFMQLMLDKIGPSASDILVPLVLVKDRFIVARNNSELSCKFPIHQRFEKNGFNFLIESATPDELVYYAFHCDFGPVNLSMVYNFYMRLDYLFRTNPNTTIVIILPENVQHEVNAAFLCGSYAILGLDVDASQVYRILTENNRECFIPFKDAGFGTFTINLHDCLRSLQRAKAEKLLDFDNFDVNEYQFYEKVENGDLNWIIPGKMLAFKTPEDKVRDLYQKPPETYFDYFRSHNVKLIVRLNYRTYDRKKFLDNGFNHQDLYFEDGSSPSLEIMHKFLNICEKTDGAVAVHCKAGLGRTGTLIACYLIKHFNFDSREAIAWARICRPGSVIGPQQSFLEQHEQLLRVLDKRNHHSMNIRSRRKSTEDCLRCPENSEKLLNIQYEDNKWSTNYEKAIRHHRVLVDDKNGDQIKKITSEVQQIVIDDYSTSADEKHLSQGDLLNLKKVHRMWKASESIENKRITRSQTRLEQNQNQPPSTQSIGARARISTDKYLKKKIATLVEKFKEAGDSEPIEPKALANKSDGCWQKKLPICSVPIKELILRFDSNSNVEKRSRKLLNANGSSGVTQRTRLSLVSAFCKNRIHCSPASARSVNHLQMTTTTKSFPVNSAISNTNKNDLKLSTSSVDNRKTSQLR